MKLKNKILTFNHFSGIPNLVHGFSTNFFGDIRPSNKNSQKALENFASELKIDPKKVTEMFQIHSNNVMWINQSDAGKSLENCDGIITDQNQIFLSVLAADCIPILIYDKQKSFTGAIHAGWKGVYNEIIKNALTLMFNRGSKPSDILVGIGPSIKACCYNIDEQRIKLFKSKFSDSDLYLQNNKFLDLPVLLKRQLSDLQIPQVNIEDHDICTACTRDFYSYRREGKKFREFIGIIGTI